MFHSHSQCMCYPGSQNWKGWDKGYVSEKQGESFWIHWVVLSEHCLNWHGKELKCCSALADMTFYIFALIFWQYGTSHTQKVVKCKWVLPYTEGGEKRYIPFTLKSDLIRDSIYQSISVPSCVANDLNHFSLRRYNLKGKIRESLKNIHN